MMGFIVDNNLANNISITVIPVYLFCLNDLNEGEKLLLIFFSSINGEWTLDKISNILNIRKRKLKEYLKELLKKDYIIKEKKENRFNYFVNSKKIIEQIIAMQDKSALDILKTNTNNLIYNPLLLVNKNVEVEIMDQITEDLKIHKGQKGREFIEVARKTKNLYIQEREFLTNLFKGYNLEKEFNELCFILKFKSKDYYNFSIAIKNYTESQIIEGTINFYRKLKENALSGPFYILKKMWISYIKNVNINNKVAQPFQDNQLKYKLHLVESFRKGLLKNIPEKYWDKIGKYVNINNVAYLPNPLTELFLYDQYPLME